MQDVQVYVPLIRSGHLETGPGLKVIKQSGWFNH